MFPDNEAFIQFHLKLHKLEGDERCFETGTSRVFLSALQIFSNSWKRIHGLIRRTAKQFQFHFINLCQDQWTAILNAFLKSRVPFPHENCTYEQQVGELHGTSDLLVASSSSESKQDVDSSSLLMKDEQLSYSAPPRPTARDE